MQLSSNELSEFTIDLAAIKMLPESVARDSIALPVRLDQGALYLVVPSTVDSSSDETIPRLRSVLQCPFHYDTAPQDELIPFVDFFYKAAFSEIQNCTSRLRYRCPKGWADLSSTADPKIRHCNVCNELVTFATNEEEISQLSAHGQCVAFYDPTEEFFMGMTL